MRFSRKVIKVELEKAKRNCEKVLDAIGEIYVGSKSKLEKILGASLAGGHVLLEDYPGVGKTLLTKLFSKAVGCDWSRIQFTPDLMPADIIGTRVWQPEKSDFRLEKGPIFSNVILADEINRATPKTQSALLEAMEERQVTIEGNIHNLSPPFFVLATQNPLEIEGTYPLPEAQLDRFLLKISLGYVDSMEKETEILKRRIKWKTDDPSKGFKSVMDRGTFLEIQKKLENSIFVHNDILEYITEIVKNTRNHSKIEVGASPRGGLALLRLSRAMALLRGREFVIPDDVKKFVEEAISHRIIISSEYRLEGTKPETLVKELVEEIEPPREFKKGD